ncbi:ABC-F family ATP-binding cassette domain-containing protein [Anaerosacchariphilus polymeriproducens]|uniref:ABC transporter ATP-binding protein n=1 Tax=Anaerosacchariphilus polymeriproducens TaxID=1812858 RepID=A0A371ATW4_9FIRM|nr:ABC-F family ATP-binding cassette domain-containing protein [Anaerosacchariphilus polymeriproducens]RDU23006.1 ABC transporter ATP-binding protein [Anaerosacchariphilus polymeriproducens]
MILACHNIKKSFGTNEIFKGGSFHIEEHEKAAIVGINGAGKSTLLKIIMEELQPDSGEVIIAKGKTLGYLAQHQDMCSDNSIYEELLEIKRPILEMEQRIRDLEIEMKLLSGEELKNKLDTYSRLNQEFELAEGYSYKSEIIGVLKGLGFEEEEFSKNVKALSGGQKTRVSLGKLLLTKPDIILLDEPTNHLDLQSINWLETYLLNYSGTVIIVAHDRYFLDRIVNKVIDIDNGQITSFSGNYSDYAEKKEMLREALVHQYMNQQQEIKHQEEVISKLKSFNREKSIKRAESREKMLQKIDKIEKPIFKENKMKLKLEPQILSGNDVLSIENLSKSFGENQLFQQIHFEIKRGERVALIGNNGTGKTTLFKIINQIMEADTGTIKLGSKVHIGYYDQEHQVLNLEKSIFEEISDAYPNLNNTEIRNVLAAFSFTNDDVFKKINDLSGGERGRISLAKLMLSESNLLLLDEPTNHLDMESKEILEHALNMYTGTVFYISHDRYFINRTATRILELTGKTLINYIGNYDYYLEKKDILTPVDQKDIQKTIEKESENKLDWKKQKEKQAKLRKRENQIKKVEQEIENLEARKEEIDFMLGQDDICTNSKKLLELHNERENIEIKLLKLYEEWEEFISSIV